MKALKWWMRAVGAFYVLLGIQNLPFIIAARLPTQYAGLAASPTSTAFRALVDTWFLFGVEMAVVGVFLLALSGDPLEHRSLIWLVLALNAIRGVGVDVYFILRSEVSAAFYIGFSVLHLIIIATGWAFLRRAQNRV